MYLNSCRRKYALMSQMHCAQPTMYKFFCFKIKNKKHGWLVHAMQSNGPLHQVLTFVNCNHSHIRTIASHVFLITFWDCNCLYVWTIASHLIFCLWTAIVRTYKQLQAISLIFGVQSFVRANDCKSSHILFLDCNCSHIWMITSLFFFFLDCNHLYVRTIASHLIFYFLNLWTAIIRTYERLQAI